MNIEKLLPCPFCGNSAQILPVSLYYGKRKEVKYYVKCSVCEIGMPMRKSYVDEDNAAKAWNTRYDTEGKRVLF